MISIFSSAPQSVEMAKYCVTSDVLLTVKKTKQKSRVMQRKNHQQKTPVIWLNVQRVYESSLNLSKLMFNYVSYNN